MNKEKLSKEELNTSIKLIRALTKISSSLTNLDNLDDGECPFFVKKMKRDFLNYGDWIENHIKSVMDAFSETNNDLIVEIILWFTEIEDNFRMDDFHDKELMLFLSKNISAIRDLDKLRHLPRMEDYINQISSRFEVLRSKGYLRSFEFIEQKNKSFEKVISQMDALGEKIVSSSE